MGGSGGSTGRNISPDKMIQLIRAQERKTKDRTFEVQASGLIARLLAGYNERDVEGIGQHLAVVKRALASDVDGTVDLCFGGSVSKHTYVNGLSDIDALVVINQSDLIDHSPNEIREYFQSRLKQRLPDTEISIGNLAVTVKFSDITIQLLPAVRIADRFRIPDFDGDTWSLIDPKGFSDHLTSVNQRLHGKLVPTIKLAKAVVSGLPESRQITGYHAESLAIEVFKKYDGEMTPKEMLKYFFTEGAKRVLGPIKDRTGQSIHVDDYLGNAGSLERRIVGDALARVGRRMDNADGAQSVDQWAKIFGE